MKAKLLTIMFAAMTFVSAGAAKYSYTFRNIPISQAILQISKDNPDINISFIYKDLDKYRTSAKIESDDLYDSLKKTIGLNPITVIKSGDCYYVEALQHGKFSYTGKAVGTDNVPVEAATVMLLNPKDSTVITYGFTDKEGRFSIPCDRNSVLGKFSCVGYRPTYHNFNTFAVGTVIMAEQAVKLGEIKAETDNARLFADRSIYIPTSRQKNASQDGSDLLLHLAIPQLRIGSDNTTVTGQPVTIYIDYIPATENDLKGMRTVDVKRIEYYDYPTDPRFMGNPHVINFIMQKYEYGGYVKGIYYDNFVISRQLNGYAKIQYKNMTYDWAGGGYYMNTDRAYENTTETYRLPQNDGSLKEFERKSVIDDVKRRRDSYWTAFKAMYRTSKTVMSNLISIIFDRTPEQYESGTVTYTPAEFNENSFTSSTKNRVNSFAYYGYWYFTLPHDNVLVFNPRYAYSHTNQWSSYLETGFNEIFNGAKDDSHQFDGDLAFAHNFGKGGSLTAMCLGELLHNRTVYSGTSTLSDRARRYRIGPGVRYSLTLNKLYGEAGIGFYWDYSKYGSAKETSISPWGNISLQYTFNPKNSISADFKYNQWSPSSNLRSESVIQANPLMYYTGNPNIVPFGSYSTSASYTFIPNNKYNFSVYGNLWYVANRYVYDYEGFEDHILRTIKQPLGKYAQWQYGLQGTTRQFDGKLQLSTSLFMRQARNGIPYNWTKSCLAWSLSAYYYLNKVYFGASYTTPTGEADGCMVGKWLSDRETYSFQVGWSNKNWNLRFFTRNFFRYHTYGAIGEMNSKYYSAINEIRAASDTGFFQISATYTFSYGKKVKEANEAYQGAGASSGILH